MLLKDQQALTFLNNQAEYIEAEVEKIDYPQVQYPDLIPLDFSAPEWTKTVTYYSMDRVGKADWFAANARDVPRADVDRAKLQTNVEMAAIGYGYNIEELSQAQAAGINLGTEKAEAAKEAYEFFVDDIALRGSTTKTFYGIINYPGITAVTVPADGSGGSTLATSKTVDQIVRDLNAGITAPWVTTQQIGWVDTVLVPPALYAYFVTTRFDPNAQMTILGWIKASNIYTASTGNQIDIRPVRGLETAGVGGTSRIVLYRKDPKVLKMHIPMRHKFLEAMRTGPLIYEVPGIFRLGGLDIKRPAEVRYVDGL